MKFRRAAAPTSVVPRAHREVVAFTRASEGYWRLKTMVTVSGLPSGPGTVTLDVSVMPARVIVLVPLVDVSVIAVPSNV